MVPMTAAVFQPALGEGVCLQEGLLAFMILLARFSQKESAKARVSQQNEGQKLEGYLAKEIESHTCPICYELMVRMRNAAVAHVHGVVLAVLKWEAGWMRNAGASKACACPSVPLW